MKVLITGGAGFIGSNFVHFWLKNHPEDQVINYDALTYAGHLENLKDIEEYPRYTFVEGNICDENKVAEVMDGVDLVVHFAAESHNDRALIDPMAFVRTNVMGTAVLLQTALRLKVGHFHHISTDEVFGHLHEGDAPFNEKTPLTPRTPYASAKASSDLFALSYFTSFGLPVTVTNCSNNYGAYQDPEKLIPRFITNILENKKVPLMGKGENIRDWLHVMDHCSAIDAVISRGKVGERYCVGGNEEHTNIDITRRILKALGKDESFIEFVPERLGHDFRYAIDSSKVMSLGWKPAYNFESGLQETIEWYQQNEWWWKPLKEGRPIVDRVAQKEY